MIREAAVPWALTIALASATVAHAHFAPRQQSISGYVETSALVVRGIVEGSDQKLEGGHSLRDGFGTLRVEEVLKGELAPSATTIRFETTGVHQPNYRDGLHVLLFLERVAGSDPPRFLTRQNAIEGVDLDAGEGPDLLATVRKFLRIDRITDRAKRAAEMKQAVLAQLDSPVELLWQDALFDLTKRTDLPLDDRDVAAIARIARGGGKPPILRVGCVEKLSELARTGDRKAMDALASALATQGELIVRTMAAAALADTQSPRAARPLVAVLGDREALVRRAAADALGRLGDAGAVDALAGVAGRDADVRVRFAALKAIARIGNEHAEQTLGALAQNPKFPDTPRAIDLARREVAQPAERK